MKNPLIFFIISLSLSSCGTYRINKTSDFGKISDLSELNGSYFSDPYIGAKSELIDLVDPDADTDFVTICFPDDSTFRIFCLNNGTWETAEFKGKKKKKYFEIYFEKKQLIIPLIFSRLSISRMRIGRYKKTNDLLIRLFSAHGANLLMIAGGSQVEYPYVYRNVEE